LSGWRRTRAATRLALAFIRRDLLIQASYRFDFLSRLAGILITTAILYYISVAVGSAASPYLQPYRVDYFHFVLLGVAFMPFIRLSVGSAARTALACQQQGTLEMLYLSRTPLVVSLLLSMVWPLGWALFEAGVYLAAGQWLFGARLAWANLLTAALVTGLAVLAHTGLGLMNAAFTLITKRAGPLAAGLGLSANLLAGVYFPVEALPPWLGRLSCLLPATPALAGLRRALLHGASVRELGPELLALAGFAAIFLPLGLLAVGWAIRRARYDGSLGQY
jgi:ABC-2 type transport system permease protein